MLNLNPYCSAMKNAWFVFIGLICGGSAVAAEVTATATNPPAAVAAVVAGVAPAQPPNSGPAASVSNAPAPQPAPAPPAASAQPKPNQPAAAQPAGPRRDIRFQFDGVPWMDVLERFAQMAGKPLVTDTNVQGTLSFNDPQPYTYAEALDMLNLMLAMKGMMLVEATNYLQLVPLKQLPQMPIKILRSAEPTGDVRPGEVVTVLLEIKNIDAKEFCDAVTPMLSNAGSLAPLPRGRGLIVTDRLANIQRIRYLLSQIDTEAVIDRQMKTYTLLHASGAILADLLNRTFGAATAPRRTQYNPQTKALDVLPPDPNDYVTAVYDDASRTLVLFGPRERVALAEELISKFEEKGGPGGDVRIYYPASLKANELADMIRQAIPGVAAPNETAASAATKARLIVDAAQNRLIVAAPIPGQLDAIESFINQVDRGVTGGKGQAGLVPVRSTTVQLTKVFRPRAAEATNVAQILTQALTRKSPTGQPMTTASVSVEPVSQSVVVSGTVGDVQIATDIVAQLETGSTQPVALETRFLDVGSPAEAKRLLPVLEQLYKNQVSDSLGQVAHAKMMADPESGRLIVTATPEHLAKIEALLAQLKPDRARELTRQLHIVPLKNARVDDVFKSLNELVTEKLSDRRFKDLPKPSLVADAAHNRLLITATDEQFKEIEQVIQALDVAPTPQVREMTVIPVQSKPVPELITLVTQLWAQVSPQPLDPRLAPKLMADPTGRQIICLATPQDNERIRALVAQLDTATASAVTRQFKGIDLHSRNATEFTPLVQQLYQEQLKGTPEPPGGPATLIADPKNNRIMVSGTEKEIARVEAIIRQLDPEGTPPTREETRVIRLRSALAGELSGLVEKALNARQQQVKVLVDQRSNSLVITGDPAAVESAAQMINQLDTRSESSPREVRLFELKQGEANATLTLVNNLFAELMKDRRGADYVVQTRLLADAAANRLIATGPREELDVLKTVVEQIDSAPEAAGGARVFKLINADAMQVVSVVSNAMLKFDARNQPIRRVSISADRESNSIIVAGPRNDLKDAEAIIQRLDNEGLEGLPGGPAGKARELKIIEVQSEDPDALASLALRVFAAQNLGRAITNLVSITPEPGGKRLIVLAPAAVLPQVETLITTLDAKPDQGVRELHAIDLKTASAAELLPTVTKIYTEQTAGRTLKPASIYADSSGTRLTVLGTKQQAEQIRQIVQTLESQARPPRETRTFDLGKLAEAQRVLPLAQQLYRDQMAANPAAGPPDAQMVSDGRTGRIIVAARTNQWPVIEAIFAQLQSAAATNNVPRQTRAFHVGTAADVQRLLPLVEQLYKDQWKDRNETDPADAQIVDDPKTGRIIATGKPDHIKAIEAILEQLGTPPKPGVLKAQTDPRDTRIFDLSTASAVELANTVRTLYLEEAKARWGNITPDTLILPDAGGNRLIVTGETPELDAIEEIVKKLDKVSAQSATARVFKLKSADPAKVAEILTTALVRYDAYGRPQKRATVSVDPKSRTLIVTGDPKELQGVSVIIEQLDSSLGAQPDRRMKVVTLQKGKVTELLPKLRQLYNDQLTAQPELGTTEVLMLEEPTSNQIILAGNQAQLDLLDKILAELQAAQTVHGPRETKIIDIGRADELNRLLPLVQQLYQERWRDRALGDPADAQILADTRNARFIVTGRTNHLAEIEKIVQELRSQDLGVPRETRIYDLTTANAAEFASTVQSLYLDQSKNRPGAQTADTSILPDATANRLIVTAATNELQIVEDIIKKLDKVTGQSGTVRVFKLKYADPAKVVEILGNALTSYDSYGRPRRRVGVTLDSKTRTIIVAGDPKEVQSLQNAAVIIEQLDTALGAQEERKIKVIPLKQAKVAELSPKVRQLYNDQLASRPDLGTTDVLILEDTPGNQLILAGNDAQLALLDKIITQLQDAVVTQGQRQTRILDVGSAEEVSRLQPLLQQLYQDQWKSREAGDPADAQIVADTKTGRLIVTGRTNHLAEIEKIFAQLSAPATNAEPRETRVYELESTTAAELATTVKSLYQEQLKTRPVAPGAQALILPDVNANRLIVSGGSNDLALIDGLIKKIDKAEAHTGRTRVFKLKSAEAEQVATILSSALVQLTPYGRSVPRVSVGTDPQNNLLIVSGAPQDLQSASVIVEQMDQMLAREPRQLRVLTLKSGLASEVANRVKQLYQDQLKGRPKTGGADALILGDDLANRLIITASESHLKLIEEIVSQLQEAGEGAGPQVRVLPLQRNSATSVAAMIAQLFRRETTSQDPGLRLVVTASSDDRMLVVEAAGKTLEKVEQLVKAIDGEPAAGALEVRTYQIPEGNAADLAQSLERLFAERAGPRGSGGWAPRFEADPTANILMVAATTNQFATITKLIEELKQTAAVASEIRTFVLKHGDPEQIANVLEDMLGEADRAGAGPAGARRGRWRSGVGFVPAAEGKTVRVSPAPSLNAVVVQGPPEKLALAEKLIATLDKADLDGQTVIQTVHLKKAHADELATAVAKTIAGRGVQSRLARVTVTAADSSNSLLLHGPADAVQEVLKIIRELDTEAEDDEINVRIFKLENGNAKEIQGVVNQLLQGVSRAQVRRRGARQVQPTVTVDERSNTLIISATESHFRMVEKLLATLDQQPSRSERDVQFVWLRNAKADEVATKVKAVFEGRPEADRPVIEADTFANSITVIARRADLPQIQEIISRLDETSKDTTLQVRLRPLDNVTAEQMARMLESIYPQMVPGRIRVVDRIQPPKREEKPAPVTVPGGPPSPRPSPPQGGGEGPRAADTALPEVVIAVDKAANALILSGPANELDVIDRIISDLTYTFIDKEAELRVFTLKEADPVMVARVLSDLFKSEQVRVEQPAVRPGEVRTVVPPPKLAVVAEPRSRSVIVRAKPTDFSLIEALIKQLDVGGMTAELQFRSVPVTNAPPAKVLPLVQQMVQQLNVIRPGEPLTVTADARARAIVVVARGTVLDQVEKVIRSLDTPSAYEEAQVRVVPLKKANAAQLAQVLNAMLRPGEQAQVTPEARELQEQVRRLKIQNDAGQPVELDLTKPIKIMADPLVGVLGGNRLILTSTPDNLRALAALVEMMDTVPVLEGVEVKVVVLQHADAATAAQTLNSIFAQAARLSTGRGGPGEPEGEVGKALARPLNVAVDARANALILSGGPESIALALKVIEDLDKPIERFVTEVRLFRLKHASATRLLPLLQAVFAEGPAVPGSEGLSTMVTRLRTVLEPGKPKTTERPKARAALVLQADELSNTLIVAARSDTLPLIEDVINQLDIPAASGMENIRIYVLNHADATAVQKIVNDLYAGPRAAWIRTEDKPTVTIDPRINALIVVGNGKGFAIVEGLIQQLDQKLPFELRDIRIIPLVNADAAEVAASLQRLMDARVTQRAAASREVADALKVTILADPRSNSLLVAGGRDSFELVETLARQLDGASPALSGRIRLVPLQHADARALAQALTTLFTQRYAAARTPDVQRRRPVIVPDPRSNSLLVAAGQDDNAAIDDLVQKLDRKREDPSMVITVLPLRHNDAARVGATLEAVFTARRQNRTIPGVGPAPQDQVEIQTDSLNNALIVYCSQENLEIIRGLLEKIDVEPTEIGGVLQAFVLQYADAQRVAAMLQSLVQQGLYRPGAPAAGAGAARTSREALAITVDPRSNTLIVSASPENMAVVKEIIKRVDTKDFVGAGDMKVYPLKRARASSLATVLEQFFRAKRAGEAIAINAPERSIPVSVIPDDRANVLLVTGTKESFDVMDRLVAQLDTESVFARISFQVFPLKKATATKLQSTLQQIVANRPPRVRGEPLDPINIVADQWVNALLVGASPEDMSLVASLIEKLDTDPADTGLSVHVFPLAKADARRIATTVQALFREGAAGAAQMPVVVNADERMNALVVSAGEADARRIGELVKKLDTDQVARVAEIKIFPLKYARAESLASILNQALNTKPTPLNEISPNTQSLLQFITRTEEGKELVTAALKEAVLITPDARMNSLIVSGPVDYMGLIEQIINRLDNASPQQAKIKVFTLVNADARHMAELLMGLFRMSATGGAGPQRAIQYTLVKPKQDELAEPGEEEEVASATVGTAEEYALAVTVDPRTNSLLVGGTDHYVNLVAQIIEELDSCPAHERRTEVYRLRNAKAQEVALAIRSFLDQERQRIVSVLGTEAVGTAQRMLEREVAVVAESTSNCLLLSANPRYFEEVRKLIEQLDQPQPQVLIQVLLAEVDLTGELDLGTEWAYRGRSGDTVYGVGAKFGLTADPTSLNPIPVPTAPPGLRGLSAAVIGSDYWFLIRALQSQGRLQVLSRPQLLTADNQPATINIGKRVPIITDTRYDQYGNTINSFRYEDVGVNLAVTPKISPDGFVRIEVGTTNSDLSSQTVDISTVKGQSVNLPVINQRRANTTVTVRSGQTVIIGGLINTSDDIQIKKVPLLGDLPGLGALFRSRNKITERRELLIFLTPQVLLSSESLEAFKHQETQTSLIKDRKRPDAIEQRLLDPIFRPATTNQAPRSSDNRPSAN